jgi:hypothetical protein
MNATIWNAAPVEGILGILMRAFGNGRIADALLYGIGTITDR